MRLNHYLILGIQDDVDLKKINEAYKAAALKWHPDKSAAWADRVEAETIFKAVNEAYETLKDPTKRYSYDYVRKFRANIANTPEETALYKLWVKLNADHQAFLKREADPVAHLQHVNQKQAATINALESQVKSLSATNQTLSQQLNAAQSAQAAAEAKYQALLESLQPEQKAQPKQPPPQFLFTASTSSNITKKIKPDGLMSISKVYTKDISGDTYYSNIRLEFSSAANAEKFKKSLHDFEKEPGQECNIILSLHSDTEFELFFKNCENRRAADKDFRLTGQLLLAELEKVVSLPGVPQKIVNKGQSSYWIPKRK